MIRRSQIRLILHGAIFMVVTMTVGGPGLWVALHWGFDEPIRQALRQWHAILMTTGIWMIATGAGLPLLELTSRGVSWIVWTLLLSGYTFILSLAVLLLGFWCYPDSRSIAIQADQARAMHAFGWINLTLIIFNGVTSIIPAGIIVKGGWTAMSHSVIDEIH